MLTQLSGKTYVKSIEREDLRALIMEVVSISGVKLVECEA